MEIIRFDADGLKDIQVDDVNDYLEKTQDVIWVDLPNPTPENLQSLKAVYKFHPLAIEDTLYEHQRPKVEEYADHLFIILNNIVKSEDDLDYRELDIYVGRDYIVTAHFDCTKVIEEVKTRIQRRGIFKHYSSEYLLYMIMDTIVDAYFPIVEQIDDEIESIGEKVFSQPDETMMTRLFQLKRQLSEMGRIVTQQRNLFNTLTRREEDLLTNRDVLHYHLRDVQDHLIQLDNIINSLRDDLSNVVDLYLSSTSHRLNIVVNRLAIITIVFGIWTVVSGFYGMNFTNTFPAIDSEHGVVFALGAMSLLTIIVLIWFKNLRWY